VPIFFEIKESDNGLIIKVSDEEGIEVTLKKEIEKVVADNKEAALKNIKLQFSKLGDTIYEVKDIKINLTQSLFFKISVLNSLRREIIEIFDKKRKESYKQEEVHFVPTKHPLIEKNLTFEANVSNSLAENFYERHGVSSIEPAFEILEDKKGKKIMTTRHCLRRVIGKCLKFKGADSIKEPLYLVNEKGYKFLLKFDCKKCQMEIYYRA
jgi:putative protease